MLGVLVVVYVFNFIDRQILAILAPAIKDELLLSDTQIGALSGVAFGIFYATLGIPIARLADRYSRVNIISICLAIWSLMTERPEIKSCCSIVTVTGSELSGRWSMAELS